MDSVFQMSEDARAASLQQISHTFGCTFVCLWSYLPLPSNCLLFVDGIYNEENKQASSSSRSVTRARRLFDEYQKSVIIIDDGRAPGIAFKNNLPYIEFKEFDLQTLASTETQSQFYQVPYLNMQEAGIKTAIYMGCKTGEIELGMSMDNRANIETEMRSLFPEDFSRQANPVEFFHPNDQNPHSSSSSSLRTLSTDSHEGMPSNFLYNIIYNTSTSYNIPEPPLTASAQPVPTTIRSIHQFPTTMVGREDAAMTSAIFAVNSSSTTTATNSHQPLQKASAFKHYRSVLLSTTTQLTSRMKKQNMLKRAIAFCRSSANLMRASQEQMIQTANGPTSSQLHHMISERKRREKINESFRTLRTLLPPGSKKDKASVLSTTTEYMKSLKAEVEELSRKHQILEAQIVHSSTNVQDLPMPFFTDRSDLDVRITKGSDSTSEARNLSVSVRAEYCSMLNLAIEVLNFLKQLKYVSLSSLQADMPVVETASLIRLVFRLKIEKRGEWDETAFLEAVKLVVADMARSQF